MADDITTSFYFQLAVLRYEALITPKMPNRDTAMPKSANPQRPELVALMKRPEMVISQPAKTTKIPRNFIYASRALAFWNRTTEMAIKTAPANAPSMLPRVMVPRNMKPMMKQNTAQPDMLVVPMGTSLCGAL